jgi:hypothetical protein
MGNSKQVPAKRRRTSTKTHDGGGKLRNAVDELVATESKKIAKALVDKTIEGNMTGAKLIVDLSGANNPQEKPKKRRGPTMAQSLAMDKLWQPPRDDDGESDPHPVESAS